LICRWLDAGEDDAAIERTLYLSTISTPDPTPHPTPQPSPEPSPEPAAVPFSALMLPKPSLTQLMLSPVPEQG